MRAVGSCATFRRAPPCAPLPRVPCDTCRAAGSPSELLHQLLDVLMSGDAPDLRDIVLLRTLLMKVRV